MTPHRAARIEAALRCRQPDLTVVLENVHDPHNISAVLRSADSVGISEVYVIRNELPRYPKFGKRSSAGAIKWLQVREFKEVSACFGALREKYTHILATHLSEEAQSLYDLDLTAPTALVFGNELEGISAEALAHCNGNYIIPQVGLVQSLNISVACAVSLYEAFRQRQLAGFYAGESRLSLENQAALRAEWGL